MEHDIMGWRLELILAGGMDFGYQAGMDKWHYRKELYWQDDLL